MPSWWLLIFLFLCFVGLIIYLNRHYLSKWWKLSQLLGHKQITMKEFMIKFFMPDEEEYKK